MTNKKSCVPFFLLLSLLVIPAPAQRKEALPKELEGVGVTEHLDVQIPLDLEFVDSGGETVQLKEFFDGTRPVILTLNYSDCPRLCIVQLNALVDTMKRMSWELGREYQVVTVSIDPLESPARAQLTKQKYLQTYGRPGTAGAWHFLVGREENIKQLAETVGFGYVYLPKTKEYVHVAVLMMCTPEGRVSRYLGGVDYDPQTLRLSLTEAAEGKVGSTMDMILLYCFHYDSASGRYGPAASNLMRAGGLVTVAIIGGTLLVFWRRERRKAKRTPESEVGE